MPCKPGDFDLFEPCSEGHLLLQTAAAACCGGCLNHWATAVELETPYVWGKLSSNPRTFTHSAVVTCKCRRTRITVLGTMEKVRGIACSGK